MSVYTETQTTLIINIIMHVWKIFTHTAPNDIDVVITGMTEMAPCADSHS